MLRSKNIKNPLTGVEPLYGSTTLAGKLSLTEHRSKQGNISVCELRDALSVTHTESIFLTIAKIEYLC